MVTLDIEDTCIRMMVVKGRRVEKAASLPLEPGLVEDGIVVDTAAVSQRINKLIAAHGVAEKQVVASISGVHSIYRVVTTPRLPGRMLDEAAKREISWVMPVPLEELYTTWQAIATSDIETVICLVGLPRNTVDAILETLHQAKLESRVMDIRSLALARIADEKDAIIVNVQPLSFDIVVMVDGIPQLLRSLPFPARDISKPDKVAVIKEELDRSVTFYNSSHKENPITANVAAFISGELGDMLAEALGYPVKPLPELLAYPEGFDASEYAINIGLALKQVKVGISQARVNINVVPEAYLPKPRPIIEFVSWAFVVAAIAVLIPLATLTSQELRQTSALQAQVNNAQLQFQIKQGTEAALEELQAEADEAKAARDVFQLPLSCSEAQREKVNLDLGKVTSLLPGTIDLQSISHKERKPKKEETAENEQVIAKYEGSKIVVTQTEAGEEITAYVEVIVEGTAPDEATILNYARALRDTGRFSEVLVSDMEEVEYNEWDFTLTLK